MDTNYLKLHAYAKVNLLLDVLRKREDGYHELEGIMQSISLYDEIGLAPADRITVECDIPLPENNTCRRAAELFFGKGGPGCRITLKKRIPSEAGLGGASADGAAVLRGLNLLYKGTPLEKSEEELYAIGLKVGADVPFCLMGGCAAARGVGERLTRVTAPELPLLIVRGSRGVSTGKLFSSLGVGSEKKSRLREGALEKALSAMGNGDIPALASCFENALQSAACEIAPEIEEYVRRMKELGALGACMTGSGAAVFGAFESQASAKEAEKAFADCDFKKAVRALPCPAPVCIVIRRASPSDAPLTAYLRREAWLTTYRGIYPDELLDGFDMEARTERDRKRLEDPSQYGFIIEADGRPCGFIFLRKQGGMHIDALYLLKEYRGFGIGRDAFGFFRELCREEGRSRFTCCCNAHNLKALAFYGRMGARITAKTLGHDDPREDQISLEFDA